MRKTVCKLAAILALVGGLALPMDAAAVTYEDSFTNCNYPKGFDLVVMRPISAATLAAGTVLWVPLGALGFFTTPADSGAIFDMMVSSPARFTFHRRLGECQAVDLAL